MNPTELSHRYIVIEGPIGVGKTHLVKRLAEHFSGKPILEHPEKNPFLEAFYLQAKQSALPTQLHFLMQRIETCKYLQHPDVVNELSIVDSMIEKDRLFANISLDDNELALYNTVYDNLSIPYRQPDLVIYLQAPLSVLKERISLRGIHYEQYIEDGYLKKLADAYADFFHHYTDAPLLIVNAEQIDLVNNEQDYLNLLDQIYNLKSGRQYYNPLAMKEQA